MEDSSYFGDETTENADNVLFATTKVKFEFTKKTGVFKSEPKFSVVNDKWKVFIFRSK